MTASYVTNAELRAALGIGVLYSDSVVEEICQSAENIVKGKLWFNRSFNSRYSILSNVATLTFDIPHVLYLGQSVTIAGNGAKINGAKTITGVTDYTITVTTSGATDVPAHAVIPIGSVTGSSDIDYSVVPEIREASLMVAVDIWQAHNSDSAGGTSPDFTPSPYKMGNTLIARVRGLISDYLSPGSMVG